MLPWKRTHTIGEHTVWRRTKPPLACGTLPTNPPITGVLSHSSADNKVLWTAYCEESLLVSPIVDVLTRLVSFQIDSFIEFLLFTCNKRETITDISKGSFLLMGSEFDLQKHLFLGKILKAITGLFWTQVWKAFGSSSICCWWY